MTGAPLPAGADAIVPVEWTDGGTGQVTIRQSAGRRATRSGGAGDDAAPGDVAAAGRDPARARAARAARRGRPRPGAGPPPPAGDGDLHRRRAGRARPPARARPDLGVQQRHAGRRGPPGRLRGHRATRWSRDDTGAVLAAIESAAARADLLVTSGGVSMGGEHDVVKAALQRARHGQVHARWPCSRACRRASAWSGTTPSRSSRCPATRSARMSRFSCSSGPRSVPLQNLAAERMPPGHGRARAPVRSPAGKRSFLRGILDAATGTVRPVSGQASHQLASLAKANALIIVPEPVSEMAAGESCRRAGAAVTEAGDQAGQLTHLDAAGPGPDGRRVGQGRHRREARPPPGRVLLSAAAVAALRGGTVPKGDALAVARIAGIQGAKRTPDLIPLCHPIGLHAVTVELDVRRRRRPRSRPRPAPPTGPASRWRR